MMVREAVEFLDGAVNLQLRIEDTEVVEWLSRFDDPEERVKLVKQALKIGVIAMTSAWAGGTTQTIRQALEGWRAEVENAVNNAIQQSRDQIISQISERFDRQVAEPIVSQIDQIARSAVDRIRERVDDLERRIDPSHPESWLGVIDEAIGELKDAFDPAKEGSYLWLVRNTLSEFYRRDGEAAKCIADTINQAFRSVQDILDAIRQGVEEIGVRLGGTALQRGLAFEREFVGRLLQNAVAVTGDLCEHVGRDNRPGDWLIQVMHGGVGGRQPIGNIVIEVRDTSQSRQEVQRSLDNAMNTRNADVGILLFARPDQNPYSVSFSVIDDNYTKMVCVWDENGLNLNFAYQLARLCILEKHLRATAQVDWGDLQEQVREIVSEVEQMNEIERRARLSKEHAEEAEEQCRRVHSNLLRRLRRLQDTISRVAG